MRSERARLRVWVKNLQFTQSAGHVGTWRRGKMFPGFFFFLTRAEEMTARLLLELQCYRKLFVCRQRKKTTKLAFTHKQTTAESSS